MPFLQHSHAEVTRIEAARETSFFQEPEPFAHGFFQSRLESMLSLESISSVGAADVLLWGDVGDLLAHTPYLAGLRVWEDTRMPLESALGQYE